MTATTSTPTAASPRSWRYPDTGGRDRRLDLLRGYALAAMAINHFGLQQSYLHAASGRSQFLISAAEAFLFISGFTLGFISIGRSVDDVTSRLRHRTWIVYLATIGISLGFGVVALTTHLELWGALEAGAYADVWQWIGQVLTLQTAFNGADILIAYVLYLAAAIAALRLMATGRTWIVVASVTGLYLLSRWSGPEAVQLGFASFRVLIPNAPLFFGGLVLGYHRHAVAELWRRVPLRRAIDAAVIVAAVGLGWLHASGWETWTVLGEWINGPELTEPLGRREERMPFASLAVVGLYLRAAWIVVDALWVPLRRALGWLLLPLGEASLFTFTMHLIAIPLVINLPGWPDEDIGRATATLWVGGYLALIWVAVLVRRRVLVWLRSGDPLREQVRRHVPIASVAVLLAVLLLVSTSPSGAAGEWAGGDGELAEELDEEDEEDEDDFPDEELANRIGTVVDRVVDGELPPEQALEELPVELGEEDGALVVELLRSDPFEAEELVRELVLEADDLP
ncbi:MAG: OpgC domain-containing protein [Actinomycetota bacterium]